jgi:hypothetical protein
VVHFVQSSRSTNVVALAYSSYASISPTTIELSKRKQRRLEMTGDNAPDKKSTNSDAPKSQPDMPTAGANTRQQAQAKERELFKRLASIKQYPIAPDPDTPDGCQS